MVQVDVVWSYAFGASFAAASTRQLVNEPKVFVNKTYSSLIHFLAILFAPSGLYLLWQFTSWETMQVAQTFSDIPDWLVLGFAVTNITQGILGYLVGYRFIRRGNFYAAHVNWMVAWILFWFILVSGWDTTGWQRFLYDGTMSHGASWSPGAYMGISFFTGNVFTALFCMGLVYTPWLWLGIVKANYVGIRHDMTIPRSQKPSIHAIVLCSLGVQFTLALLLAIVAAMIVKGFAIWTGVVWLGYLLGLPLAIAAGYFLLFKRGMPMHFIARQLYVKEP